MKPKANPPMTGYKGEGNTMISSFILTKRQFDELERMMKSWSDGLGKPLRYENSSGSVIELNGDLVYITIANTLTPHTPIESTAEVMTDKPKRDLTTIKTNTDMVKACFTDFGMQPPEVLKELNVSRLTDLTEKPAESYQRIAAVRK